MEGRGAIDMEIQDTKFYVSTVTLKVKYWCLFGIVFNSPWARQRSFSLGLYGACAILKLTEISLSFSWLQDKDSVLFSVAGGGRPIQLQNTSFQGRRISASKVPTSEVAVTAYESQGGNSTVFPCFGVDPLDKTALQALREQRFNIGNANCHSFENAILTYASITMQLLT